MKETYKPALLSTSIFLLLSSCAQAQDSMAPSAAPGSPGEKTLLKSGAPAPTMNDFLGSSRLQPDRHPDGRPTMLPPSASDYLEGPAPLAPQKTLLPLPGSQSTGAAPGSNDADQPQFYAGPHQAGKYGGIYPPAGDSKLDVDLDGTTRQAIFGSPDWAKEPGKDMRYYQDDTQYHGTGDPFGFF